MIPNSARVFLFALLIAIAAPLAAQQPEQTVPPYLEVHVDEHCRIFTEDRPGQDQRYSKPRFRSDPTACRLKGVKNTSHWEQTADNGVLQRTKVQIHERTYILSNATPQPVTFVVDQSLPAGWVIDSVPQPMEVADSMATFKVVAMPGQTIQLHVGERH